MRKLKTHCLRGHALIAGNLYDRGDGTRVCRACRSIRSSAYEKAHPRRVKTVGKPKGPRPTSPDVRFDRKWTVDPVTGCHVWSATTTGAGYGLFYVQQHKRQILAHRFSYERARGPIRTGLHIDHLCRNKGCVNPDHLEAVAPQENHRRAEWKARTHCKRGHEMTPDNVYVRPNGGRRCRACAQQSARSFAQKRYVPRDPNSLPSSAGLLSLAFV